MGCTSSAPSAVPPHVPRADKSIQSEEEIEDYPPTGGAAAVRARAVVTNTQTDDDTKVLPPRDPVDPTVLLLGNSRCSSDSPTAKEVPVNGHVVDSDSVFKTPDNRPAEVTIPKLELLIDQVIEINHHSNETDLEVPEIDKSDSRSPEPHENIDTNNGNSEETIETEPSGTPQSKVENDTAEEEEEEREETSPSRSQCSRATRWEALADIAAELPPSLAVDPITGQIYQMALHR